MNKKKIEKMLPLALETLRDEGNCGISKNRKIDKSYRSAISSFGAAVTMGSFRAAVAFFSKDADKGETGISRSLLLRAIHHVCKGEWLKADDICGKVLDPNLENIKQLEQDYLHAAVALKLAMNAFDMNPEEKNKPKGGPADGKPESAVQ